MNTRLEKVYRGEGRLNLMRELGKDNFFSLPKLEKIVVTSGIGKFKDDAKLIESCVADLKSITGQTPKITRARRAISAFKLKANDVVGLVVTLRGEKMWSFFDKLVSVVLPRVRDFRGLDEKSLDGRGSLSLGFVEHTVFPEIDVNHVDRLKSLGVTLRTSASDNRETKIFLSALGFPFKKKQ